MLEVIAMSEVTRFADVPEGLTRTKVPLVNVMASKVAFRPFIYLKDEDVIPLFKVSFNSECPL